MAFTCHYRFDCVGDVRGSGLLLAVEIVNNKTERVPAGHAAQEIMYGLKSRQIWTQITGRDRNVLLLTPPLCFTIEDGHSLVRALSLLLTERTHRPLQPQCMLARKREYSRISHVTETISQETMEEDFHDSLCDMD